MARARHSAIAVFVCMCVCDVCLRSTGHTPRPPAHTCRPLTLCVCVCCCRAAYAAADNRGPSPCSRSAYEMLPDSASPAPCSPPACKAPAGKGPPAGPAAAAAAGCARGPTKFVARQEKKHPGLGQPAKTQAQPPLQAAPWAVQSTPKGKPPAGTRTPAPAYPFSNPPQHTQQANLPIQPIII